MDCFLDDTKRKPDTDSGQPEKKRRTLEDPVAPPTKWPDMVHGFSLADGEVGSAAATIPRACIPSCLVSTKSSPVLIAVDIPDLLECFVFEEQNENESDGNNSNNSVSRFGNCESCISQHYGKSLDESSRLCLRCEPSWSALSDKQRATIVCLEAHADTNNTPPWDDKCLGTARRLAIAIVEGPGGCGKTRMMGHIVRHPPPGVLVIYMTKQNKRVQDFVNDDVPSVPGRGRLPVDMSTFRRNDIQSVVENGRGSFACTVEKFLCNTTSISLKDMSDRNTSPEKILKWRCDYNKKYSSGVTDTGRRVIVLLDEYTMLSPPMLHLLVDVLCTRTGCPLLLVMAGDKNQLGPVDWGPETDVQVRAYCSDIRLEIGRQLAVSPLEIQMTEYLRCKDDVRTMSIVEYLRGACQSKTLRHYVQRRVVQFGVAANVPVYRSENGLVVESALDPGETLDAAAALNEDRYAGEWEYLDDDNVETTELTQTPRLEFGRSFAILQNLYRRLANDYTNVASLYSDRGEYVYETVCEKMRHTCPLYMFKSNEACTSVADAYLRGLYSALWHAAAADKDDRNTTETHAVLRSSCKEILLSEPATPGRRVQILMVGMVYRMTATLRSSGETSTTMLCHGEQVMLTDLWTEMDGSGNGAECVVKIGVRTLQRRRPHLFVLFPGRTSNRISGDRPLTMFPLVPMVTENIYQMQGNTIDRETKCFVDLADCQREDFYVALSRFKTSNSISGIRL